MDEALSALRSEIDALDERLIELIARRQDCVARAGVLKRGQPVSHVRAPGRVEEVVARARRIAREVGASELLVEVVYRAMIEQFILLEIEAHSDEGASSAPSDQQRVGGGGGDSG